MGGITPRFYMDGYRLCRQVDRPGKSPEVSVYNDRRAGMTFPTANNPGYFCIFGLKDVVTHRDKLPLELLAEGKYTDQYQMFVSLCRYMRLMRCKYVYADCSLEFRSNEIEFEKYLRRAGIHTVGLWDASEFDGFTSAYAGFEAARAPIDEYGRKSLLRISKDSDLMRELGIIEPEDIKEQRPWERFPAINAFNHVIMSYVISPWIKPEKQFASDHERTEGYGG